MQYDLATAKAETRYDEYMSTEDDHRWRLTAEELRLPEHLLTAPTLRRFADALNTEARTLNVQRLRPLGRSKPVNPTEQLMLMILLSLVTVPHITRAYGGYDPELTALLELPAKDLSVVLKAMVMRAAIA